MLTTFFLEYLAQFSLWWPYFDVFVVKFLFSSIFFIVDNRSFQNLPPAFYKHKPMCLIFSSSHINSYQLNHSGCLFYRCADGFTVWSLGPGVVFTQCPWNWTSSIGYSFFDNLPQCDCYWGPQNVSHTFTSRWHIFRFFPNLCCVAFLGGSDLLYVLNICRIDDYNKEVSLPNATQQKSRRKRFENNDLEFWDQVLWLNPITFSTFLFVCLFANSCEVEYQLQ